MHMIDIEMMSAEELRAALKCAETAMNTIAHLAENAAYPDQAKLDANQRAEIAAEFFAQCMKLDDIYAAAEKRMTVHGHRLDAPTSTP